MKTIEQMVQQEIQCCLSSLVATLASGDAHPGTELAELCDRALGLAMAVPDFEEAAREKGWLPRESGGHYKTVSEHGVGYDDTTWETLCERENIEPYDSEVFEHWAVSEWLAERLLAHGEKVDTDFAWLNVWARTVTGQQISADGVIHRIYADMMKD